MRFRYNDDVFATSLRPCVKLPHIVKIPITMGWKIIIKYFQLKYSVRGKLLHSQTKKKGGAKIFSISFNFPFIKHQNGKKNLLNEAKRDRGNFLAEKNTSNQHLNSDRITYIPKGIFGSSESRENCWFSVLVIFIGSFRPDSTWISERLKSSAI